MISPVEIAAPKNYHDFEFLCLKLWGEIWEIPHEIEFNSDNPQGQNGVDVYGIPKGEQSYFGIQCKNRKLNLINGEKNRITITDIDQEIFKALSFKPQLKKLIIATSLNKDRQIEEHVRLKNQEHIEKGLFTIQMCFWEFFQRKILEFKNVSDWYLKNENYLQIKKLDLLINDEKKVTFFPKFKKINKIYQLEPEDIRKINKDANIRVVKDGLDITDVYPKPIPKIELKSLSDLFSFSKIEWKQYCWFRIRVKNVGQSVIEDFKIDLKFKGDFEEIGVEQPFFTHAKDFKRNIFEYSNAKSNLLIEPLSAILVQNNSFVSNNIYIKPVKNKMQIIEVHWNAIGRDFQDSGILHIETQPKYLVENEYYYVNDPSMVGNQIGYDFIQRQGMADLAGPRFFDNEKDFHYE